MKAEDYTPRGAAKVKLSDNPDFVPYRGTFPKSYSLKPFQIQFVKEKGGSKYVRNLISNAMELENGKS